MKSYETHICDERTSNLTKTTVSFCGELLGNEFHYTGVDHAVADRQAKGRLLPCPKCKKRIIELLNET
jgi:hypothetical protein